MKGEEAYGDFIKSTGFGDRPGMAPLSSAKKSVVPDPSQYGDPAPQMRSAEAKKFETQYHSSDARAIMKAPIQNAVKPTQGQPVLQGAVRPSEYHGQNHLGTPLRYKNVLGNMDSRAQPGIYGDKRWAAVGVGGEQGSPELGRVAARRFRSENMSGATSRLGKRELGILITVAAFGFIISIVKWNGKRNNPSASKQWGVSGVVFLAALGTASYYYKISDKPENMGGRLPIGDNNFPVVPIQRGQPDPEVYRKVPDPQDDKEQRMRRIGVDGSNLEGPRANYGYQRGKVTEEDYQRLQESELMRSARNMNMDKGTFNEYMARLDGEAPNQFVQKQPYMPFTAEWEERSMIDDMSNKFGVSTGPDPANRKYKYKETRMLQAGAKTMHTKDPPPGSVPPLEKIHPWMEKDMSGQEAPVLLGAEVLNHEKLTAQDTQSFAKSRMVETQILEVPQQEQDNDFMQPVEIKKEVKHSFPVRPSFLPDGSEEQKAPDGSGQQMRMPPIPQDNIPMLQASRQKAAIPSEFPQEDSVQQIQGLNSQFMDHRADPAREQPAPETGGGLHQGYDEDDSGVAGAFEAAFAPLKTPSESEIQKAQADVRRS